MANHSSATPRTIKSTKNLNINGTNRKTNNRSTKNKTLSPNGTSTNNTTHNLNGGSKKTISNALKRRAQAVIKDSSIDAETRAIIRYGLEINDPWLPELVRRIEAGETIIETIVLLKHS